MLSVTFKPCMLSVTFKLCMLSVIMLNFVMLSVVAPPLRTDLSNGVRSGDLVREYQPRAEVANIGIKTLPYYSNTQKQFNHIGPNKHISGCALKIFLLAVLGWEVPRHKRDECMAIFVVKVQVAQNSDIRHSEECHSAKIQ
jgi:hypothetical protein